MDFADLLPSRNPKLIFMQVAEFLKIFYSELQSCYKSHPYTSFAIICSGIELVGKCLDEKHEFTDYNPKIVKKQFNAAIRLMSPKYSGLDLHKQLRHSMVHSLLTGNKFALGERNKTNHKHLSKVSFNGSERTIILLEDFFDDFKSACDTVIKRIDNGNLKHQKLVREFITIKE